MYTSPRAFKYYMSCKSGEEREREQNKDKLNIDPIRLDTIENGIRNHALDKMLAYESGRVDYRRISNINPCTGIDQNIVHKYGKISVYHLTREEKQQIGELLYRQYRIGEAQIRRCLAM